MTITASMVKELRAKTSAGMLDCKKALQESGGDFGKATDWLRKKGLSQAAKRAGKVAAEGLVTSYIHGEGRIGVLVEVNSETDFVARNDEFKSFVKEIAMHIVATNPLYVSMEDIPQKEIDKEKEILATRARDSGKKEELIEKIVGGQIKKWSSEQALLDQPFVKNPDVTIKDHLASAVAKIGENIVIRRFVRFELGEGLEKKQGSFADEVAEQLKG